MSSEAKATQAALVKHKCPDCGFTAPSQSKLTVHHRVHSGERPFACLSCDSTFVSKGHRDRHARRVHLKADQIPCSFSGCDKTFSCVASMRRHIAAVHLKTRFAVLSLDARSQVDGKITSTHTSELFTRRRNLSLAPSLDAASDQRISPILSTTDSRFMKGDASLALTETATSAPRGLRS